MTYLLIVLIILFIFSVIVYRQPNEFRVTRRLTIETAAVNIFAHVNDLTKWAAWSPWAKLDPDAINTFEGSASGTNASMTWAGNKNVGEGRMTIIESTPNSFIKFKLEFKKPMVATNIAEFSFESVDNQTMVTWTMYGTSTFISKAVGLIMNCEKMVGGQFEKGLADLKTITEKNE